MFLQDSTLYVLKLLKIMFYVRLKTVENPKRHFNPIESKLVFPLVLDDLKGVQGIVKRPLRYGRCNAVSASVICVLHISLNREKKKYKIF